MKNPETSVVLKVSVLQSGKVLVDGNETSLQDLDKQLSQTKSQNGVVWYYRENAKGNPPAAAKEVIDLIMKYKIPISLSSKPDFSDTIDEQGVSHSR